MPNYLRESLHWMHLAFFKPLTLAKETEKFTRKQWVITFLKIYLVAGPIILLLLVIVGGMAELVGLSFDWNKAFVGLGVGQVGWLNGLVSGLFFGLFAGLGFGLVVGLFGGLRMRLGIKLWNGLLLGLNIGLGVGLLDNGLARFPNYALAYLPIYFLVYFRGFYLLPYTLQYWRANVASNPFPIFRNSPVYWDEVIATPLPYLKDWLVNLVKRDHERGMKEILFVAASRPFQRKAAIKALLAVAGQDLQLIHDLQGLAKAADLLKAFPAEDGTLLKGLDDARRRLNTISALAQNYQTRLTLDGQLELLRQLYSELSTFHSAMTLTSAPVGTTFQPLARRWLEIVNDKGEEMTLQRRFLITLSNPYVAGTPLQTQDFSLLKGRRDIIRAIEKYILNTEQRPSLLLYGRRRSGKSSTLLNLPLLLSSQFEPVYIDCQDAKWHESDQAFCYNLAREIFERLFQSDDVKGIRQPQEVQFEKNAFTRLDEYLDQFERLATERGKRILLAFDEYEGLEESIAGGDISKNVLGKLRNIIQHRQRIVVLVSGSHRFEELTGMNWASYLINTRTLELSFLDELSARELLTEPVPQLRYEDGVLEEIIRLTRCQPYLLQAVASELVNHLNELQKTTAERADLDATIDKVLTSAGAYFANTWREDNSATEQTVLRAYAEGASERVAAAEFHSALQSLIRKEMMERDGDAYRLAVPLFGLWILRNQVD